MAGALASPLAVQAQTANVTLYGRVNIDLEFVKGEQADGSNPTVNRVSSNSSRFGLRGTESLGGGLNAIFQIEQNVSADTGNAASSSLGSRETFAGLQGSWGKVTMGKFLMPQDDVRFIFDNSITLGTSLLSDGALYAQAQESKTNGGFDARTGNNVRYDSPTYMGFTAALQYSTRDSSGDTQNFISCTPAIGAIVGGVPTTTFTCPTLAASAGNNNGGDSGNHLGEVRHANVIGGNVIYNNGPISAAVSFERNNKLRAYVTDAALPANPAGTCRSGSSIACPFFANDTDWTIAGSYDFGTIMQGFGLRLGVGYERTKYDTPSGDLKRDYWGLSATVPVGGGKAQFLYGKASKGKGGASDNEAAIGQLRHGADTGSKLWQISYVYSLSPRTLLQTGYIKINNEARASYTFHINPYTIRQGGDPSALMFGIVHLF
ncbi:MAG: porin [Pseudomonadota bacterium]|nr:porin [Pseudomonadota bacterium]